MDFNSKGLSLMAGEIHDWKSKIDKIADNLKSQGVCEAEAKALQLAGREAREAQDDLEHAQNSRDWNGLVSVGGGIAVASCPALELGAPAVACVFGGMLAGLGGLANWLLGDEQVDRAREELDEALDDMSSAVDDVCHCMTKNRVADS